MARQELDVDAITAELDQEFAEQEVQEESTEEEVEEPETQVQEDFEEDEEFNEADEEDELESDEEETEPTPDDEDIHRRNEAFKRLREERDRLAQSDKFLSDLASQYGITKEQLIERYQKELTEKRAKESNMDPEQFRKMQELERKVQEIEESKNREVFNVKANDLANRYNLSDDQMMDLFNYASEMNLDILGNPDLLDVVYRATTYDQAIEKGRQAQLETTKKRKATSTGKTGTAGKQVNTTDEDMQAEIDAFLKEQNIIKE